jgi:DNA-binding NarL/FixJ family response regulator
MDGSDEYTAQNLSARQRDVFELIVRGLSNKEIARALNLAEGTVKIHVAALLRKLGVHRRAAAAIAGGALSAPAAGGQPPAPPENHLRAWR